MPPDIELERLLLRADQAVEDQDREAARRAMERIQALQQQHGLKTVPEEYFRYATIWQVAGDPDEVWAALSEYLQLLGREAPNYREALLLLNEVEALPSAPILLSASGRGEAEEPLRTAPVGPAGMEFVWIPAGEFRMGSTSAEANDDEQPVTLVRISEGFWLGKYEVTQSEWQAVMGSNPSRFADCGGNCPVDQVSWDDVQEFIARLNAEAGRASYRLPTEAEWEYAARAGAAGDRYGSLDAVAWHDGNSGGRTRRVGGKAPNALGLHDMLGNVWEWVRDRYEDYPGGSVTDPIGPESGYRVRRGGGWDNGATNVRAPDRGSGHSGFRHHSLGFRLLRTR